MNHKLIEELLKNPIYAMSLHEKELFHSNFWGWLFEHDIAYAQIFFPEINEIGERLAREYGVRHLPSDFKKRGGYQRSIQLSHEYNLYRQDYCGCIFSQKEREEQKRRKAEDEPAGQIFPDRTNSITG